MDSNNVNVPASNETELQKVIFDFEDIQIAPSLRVPGIVQYFMGNTFKLVSSNFSNMLRKAADESTDRIHSLSSPPNENFKYQIIVVANKEAILKILQKERNEFKPNEKDNPVVKGQTLNVSTPVLGEHGVFNIEKGELWTKLRELITNNFNELIKGDKLDRIIEEETVKVISKWNNRTLDIRHDVESITLEIIWRVLLGDNIASEQLVNLSNNMKKALRYIIFHARLPEFSKKLNPNTPKFHKSVEDIHSFFADLIMKLNLQENIGDDLSTLSYLLNEADKEINEDLLNDEIIKENALVLFFAGHETTTLVQNWLLYYLGKEENFIWQQKLHKASEEQSKYIRKGVVGEGLRLRAPTTAMPREALEAFSIELDNGHIYNIPKGALIMLDFPNSMRDPNLFDERTIEFKDKFSPEAYLGDPVIRRKITGVQMGYGAGARRCVGANLADYMLDLITKIITDKYWFRNQTIHEYGEDGELNETSGPTFLREPGSFEMYFEEKIRPDSV